MRALLDVNVLIALLDVDHPLHSSAATWLKSNAAHGWASCPLTENGCVRIMSQPGYSHPLAASAVIARLAEAAAGPSHEFWPADVSLLDRTIVDPSRVLGPRQVTDLYLLALAVRHGGRFVTYDGGVPLSAVRGATPQHLLVL